MATFTRNYVIPKNGLINSVALADELDRIAVAHNANNRILEGKQNLQFDAGFGIEYDSAENAFGKYVTVTDTSNDDDFPSFAPTESDTTFTQLQIPDSCQAFGGSAGEAKAFHFGVTFRAGDNNGAGTSEVAHPLDVTLPYTVAEALIIRENGQGVTANLSDGQHLFPISNDTTRIFGANEVAYAECIIRNMTTAGAYNTATPRYVQVRIGTNAGGQTNGGPPTLLERCLVSLRLLGFYV